jgi:hypothetical protein
MGRLLCCRPSPQMLLPGKPPLVQNHISLTSKAQVKRISLSKNILRALEANPDIPPLSEYPRSHQVHFVQTVHILS